MLDQSHRFPTANVWILLFNHGLKLARPPLARRYPCGFAFYLADPISSVQRITRIRNMIHEELSGKIIGAGMEVLNELKPGLDEKLYELL